MHQACTLYVELKHRQCLSDLQTFTQTSAVATQWNVCSWPAGSCCAGEGAVECSRRMGAFVQQNLGVTFLVLRDGFVRTVQHARGFRTALLTGYDAICWFSVKTAGL